METNIKQLNESILIRTMTNEIRMRLTRVTKKLTGRTAKLNFPKTATNCRRVVELRIKDTQPRIP